jgi:hypothetical protein
VLNPFAKTLAWYGVGGYAIALLCAIPYFSAPATLRKANLLALAGVLHPVIALAAVGISGDVDPETPGWAGSRVLASASLAVSVLVCAVLFLVTAT